MILKRNSRMKIITAVIFSALVFLIYLRKSTYKSNPKTIQFRHNNSEIGDQLFSLFSHIGVAESIGRIPVINTVNNSVLIEQLSRVIVIRFPSILQQFSIVIHPPTSVNAKLGSVDNPYEDPIKKFSEYTALSIMVDGDGFKSYKYFDHFRKQIRLWMLGDAENLQEAKSLLSESLRDNFKICVHTTTETLVNSTIKATSKLLNHYIQDNSKMMLVVSAPNPGIARQIFVDSRIKQYDIEKFSMISSPAELQLTFSRIYCDVVFITDPFSTFGWWMGYLANKENSPVFFFDPEVYPKQKTINQDDFFPPKWKKLTRKV